MRPGYRSTGQPSTWGPRVRGRRLCTARLLGKSVGEGEVAEGFLLAEGSGPGWEDGSLDRQGEMGREKCARQRGRGREVCRVSGPMGTE